MEKLFDSLKSKYQNNLQSMRSSKFVFDYVKLLYYKCHEINLNHGGSYIDSLDWIKKQKTTINPINKKDSKYFQYSVTFTLNYEELKWDPQRITKFKPFTNKCSCEGINCPSEKYPCKTFDKNNVTIALNVLYAKKDKIYILLMFQIIT